MASQTSKEIGQYIKALRQEKGMSAYRAARLLHVADTSLAKYESGKTEFPLPVLARIAPILGIDFTIGDRRIEDLDTD